MYVGMMYSLEKGVVLSSTYIQLNFSYVLVFELG